MKLEIMLTSDCCGVIVDGIFAQYEICPDCKEHCEIISEEVPVSR